MFRFIHYVFIAQGEHKMNPKIQQEQAENIMLL